MGNPKSASSSGCIVRRNGRARAPVKVVMVRKWQTGGVARLYLPHKDCASVAGMTFSQEGVGGAGAGGSVSVTAMPLVSVVVMENEVETPMGSVAKSLPSPRVSITAVIV